MASKDDKDQAAQPEPKRPNVKVVANPGPVDELFVDGVSGLITRGGVVKLDLFRVVGYEPESKAELRQVCHRLVFPLTVLPELMKLFQSVARAAQQAAEQQAAAKADAVVEGETTTVPDPLV